MTTKVNNKTKKPFMIMAAVERGLFSNNLDAAKHTNAELYEMIKQYDSNAESKSADVEQSKKEEQPVVEGDVKADGETAINKDSGSKKRRLPNKTNKKNLPKQDNGDAKKDSETVAKVEQQAAGNVHQEHTVETQNDVDSAKSDKKDKKQKVDLITYDDPKPFRTLLLSLLRKRLGVNYNSLKNSGLSKKNYTKAIEYLNESIDVARVVLGSKEETDVLVHVVGSDGNVTEHNIYIHRDMISEEIAKLEEVELENANEQVSDTTKNDDNVTKADYEQSDEEKEIADTILMTFNVLKVELDTVRKENAGLKKENLKLQAKVSNDQRHDVDVHDSIVDFMNKLANTKDECYVWVWKELNKILGSKLPVATDKSPVVLDIEKLIIEESVRLHNEAEAKRELEEKKARAIEADTEYDGVNISYIGNDVVKPSGVKKRTFNIYKEWYDDCKMWVEYVLQELEKIDSIGAKKKRKAKIDNLELELDEWYDEWYENDCDDDAVDMVAEVMGELVHSKQSDRNLHKTLSDLVAIVDSLELE